MPTSEPTVAEDFSAVDRALENGRLLYGRHDPGVEPERRAQRLLWKHLTPQQRREYERSYGDWFIVPGAVYDYKLRRRFSNNIEVFTKNGLFVATLCAFARGVPDGDNRLAQKLAIEIEEDRFTRVARGQVYSI